jgi:hypothetical protein
MDSPGDGFAGRFYMWFPTKQRGNALFTLVSGVLYDPLLLFQQAFLP